MTEMKLLLVEDTLSEQESCKNAVQDLWEENGWEIELTVCKDVEEALHTLQNSYFDGAIIDLKLDKEGDEGNQVIKVIKDSFRRIPVIVHTGTPDVADTGDSTVIKVYKRDQKAYRDVINELRDIYITGITKIMGGLGEIEQNLSKVFIENLLPQIDTWKTYGGSDSQRSEKALLRHTLNHLLQILDNDVDKYYPEEMYIYPPATKRINTGCIIENKESVGELYIVLSPACDLAKRQGGGCNTDRALLAKIDTEVEYYLSRGVTEIPSRDSNALTNVKKNTTGNYHWLPKTDFFGGGLINFRKISAYTQEEFNKGFNKPHVQVSSSFLKDIVSRFSSYYARQGQPDIDRSFY